MKDKEEDTVIVTIDGLKYKGTLVSINEYREPEHKYAVEIDGFSDYVFVDETHLSRA